MSWIRAHSCTPKRSRKVYLTEKSNDESNNLLKTGYNTTGQASYARDRIRDAQRKHDAI